MPEKKIETIHRAVNTAKKAVSLAEQQGYKVDEEFSCQLVGAAFKGASLAILKNMIDVHFAPCAGTPVTSEDAEIIFVS